MFRDSFFLAIGIDEYPGEKRLNNAVGDAKRIAQLLEEKYGFKTVRPPLFDKDATRVNITNALDGLASSIGPEDNLIIYYAGHGNKLPTSDAGYWEPVDFDNELSNRINNSLVLDAIEGIAAKHILLISDSCFSATFLTRDRSGTMPTDHDYLDGLKSGWILVSGGMENVGDGKKGEGSTFNRTMCRILERNSRPSLAAGELFDELIRVMTESTLQTPGAAPIKRDSIHQGGQMIFRLRDAASKVHPEFPMPAINIQTEYLPRTLTSYTDQRPALSFFYEPEVGNVNIDDIITTQRRIVMLGGAGSGKSIELSKAMERVRASNKGLIPVFRRLNNYTDGELDKYLPAGWNDVPGERLVVFLDGLDEIQPQFLNTALRKIGDFGDRFPDTTIVISCRTNFYELPSKSFSGTLSGFKVYLLNDISFQTIKTFVQSAGLDGEYFIREVQKWNYLDLVQKPYFLNILFIFFQQHGNLEIRRSDVLNDALDRYFAANKEQYKNGEPPIPHKQLISLAERIAFVMELMGKNFITDQEIAKFITNEKEYGSLRYLPAFKYDQEKEYWYFEHNNIQEYLASRILKKQEFSKMIEVLTLSSAGIAKIKPTWVNTLSFMISIGENEEIKDIIDWLVKNEPEILVRFDPDRLPLNNRIEIFKLIFEHYRKLQIWLSSNKFSDTDLARFGQSEEILNFLLEVIADLNSTRIDILNTCHILRKLEISKFPSYKATVKSLLLKTLERDDLNPGDEYSIIGSLADLGFTDDDTLQYLISKYGERENQYLRAGLYRIIGRSEHRDRYADVFLSGLRFNNFNYQSKDRSQVTLMDEVHQLREAIEQFKSPDAIRKLLDIVDKDINSVHQFFSEFYEEMPLILENVFAAYDQDRSLFPALAKFFAHHATENRSKFVAQMLERIDARGIRWEVLQFVLSGKGLRDYELLSAGAALINKEMIDLLIDQYKKGTIPKEKLKQIFSNFSWQQTNWPDYSERLKYFRKMLSENTDLKIPEEPEIDRNTQFKEKAQKNFDVIFDVSALKAEVDAVFAFLEKDEVSSEDLFGYKNGEYVNIGDRFSSTVSDLIREFTYGNAKVSRDTISDWIDKSPQFENFRIQLIKSRISSLPELNIKEEHLHFIDKWVKKTEVTNSYTWYFINKFKIALSENRYLDFTRYFSPSEEREPQQTGFIELLQPFISKARLQDEVRSNLINKDLPINVWASNAGYALRNDLKDTYETIIKTIAGIEQSEQRVEDLLKFWFEKTGDVGTLIKLVGEVNDNSIKEVALRQLLDSGRAKDFLIQYYQDSLASSSVSEADLFLSANRLIKLGVIEGFEVLANRFLEAPSPAFDFRQHFRSISGITDPAALSTLMKLLHYARQPEYRNDVFNDLEPILLESLFNIGIQSRENFEAVKSAIRQFIEAHKDIPHINFLEFSITKIEDQLNIKLSKEFGFEEALALLDTIK